MTPDRIVEFAEGLGRIAASGGGSNALAAYLAETAGAGVLIEDADWRHVAAAGTGSLPATARDLFDAGITEIRMARAHRNGSPASSFPIVAGQSQLGWLSVFGARVDDATAEALARLTASVVAIDLARDQGGGRGRRRMFWDRLASGAYQDTNAARDDAAARGVSVAPHYVAIVLESEASSEESVAGEMSALRALVSDAFHCSDAELGLLERGTQLIAVVPTPREVDVENAQTAAALLPKTAIKRKIAVRFSGGVSSAVPMLDVPRAIASAGVALAIARRIYQGPRVAAYADLGIYPLLFEGARVDELQRFAAGVLAPLRDYDEKHQTELGRTLRLYFSVGENVKTASAELNVHRHTVFYRLRQIGEITGRSLESAHDQLTLRLAIAIDALHTI